MTNVRRRGEAECDTLTMVSRLISRISIIRAVEAAVTRNTEPVSPTSQHPHAGCLLSSPLATPCWRCCLPAARGRPASWRSSAPPWASQRGCRRATRHLLLALLLLLPLILVLVVQNGRATWPCSLESPLFYTPLRVRPPVDMMLAMLLVTLLQGRMGGEEKQGSHKGTRNAPPVHPREGERAKQG